MNDETRQKTQRTPCVGDTFSWKPSAFFNTDESIPGRTQVKTVHGRIVYINREHCYFTAEAFVNGYAIRESFKMRSAPEAVRRTGYRH